MLKIIPTTPKNQDKSLIISFEFILLSINILLIYLAADTIEVAAIAVGNVMPQKIGENLCSLKILKT